MHHFMCFDMIPSTSYSGDSHPDEISVLAVDRDLVFTGCQNVIRAFTRGKQVGLEIKLQGYLS